MRWRFQHRSKWKKNKKHVFCVPTDLTSASSLYPNHFSPVFSDLFAALFLYPPIHINTTAKAASDFDIHTYIDCISSKSPKTFQFSLRLISAVSWQRSTPTSRFRVCTTWRGWTCTPSTIWGSSLHISLPSPTSATVASGNATTASVSSSG